MHVGNFPVLFSVWYMKPITFIQTELLTIMYCGTFKN